MNADIQNLKKIAQTIRRDVIEMAHQAHCGHIGSALSTVDIVTALYFKFMRIDPKNPVLPDRDRFILSKGHGAAAYYAVLAERGFFDKELLKTYMQDGGNFAAHPSIHGVPGIEFSTGSLGHGLSVGTGMAKAAKHDKTSARVFVMVSDGECDEGSTWEAALSASHLKLDNLTVIVDYNKLQAFGRTNEVLNLEPFAAKWEAFGFATAEINGHDMDQIVESISRLPLSKEKPTAIIAHTVLGKGVSFMEDQLAWHYNFMTNDQYALAVQELSL